MTATMLSGFSPEVDRNEAAMDQRTEYLMCRRSVCGHPWEPYQDGTLSTPSFGFRFSLRCTRCGTQRHDLRGFRGELLSRSYVYPDDYKMGGTVSTEELWTEVLVRLSDGRLVLKAKRIRGTKTLKAVK